MLGLNSLHSFGMEIRGGDCEMEESCMQEMALKRNREFAGGTSSSLAANDTSSDPKKVCLIVSHMEKPIAYEIYLIDARDIGCNSRRSSSSKTDDDNDWTKQQMQILTSAIELPSSKYPSSMGFFNMGSKVYMFGGVRVTPPSHTRSEKKYIH